MLFRFRELPPMLAHAVLALLSAAAPALAQAEAGPLPAGWLLPDRFSGSVVQLPGERWEGRLTGERRLTLQPGMEWQTSTDLRRTRFEQIYPVRSQGFSLSTGPQIKLGAAEFALPWSAGRETYSVGNGSAWNSGAPRMTVALGANDRIRLEAKVSRRREAGATQRRRMTSLSWRHSFANDWSMTAGLREIYESGAVESSLTAETYASVDARFSDRWRWSLASTLSEWRRAGSTDLQPSPHDRSASLSVSTRYRLSDGWWISGELKSTQSYRGDEQRPLMHAGGMKLYRDF